MPRSTSSETIGRKEKVVFPLSAAALLLSGTDDILFGVDVAATMDSLVPAGGMRRINCYIPFNWYYVWCYTFVAPLSPQRRNGIPAPRPNWFSLLISLTGIPVQIQVSMGIITISSLSEVTMVSTHFSFPSRIGGRTRFIGRRRINCGRREEAPSTPPDDVWSMAHPLSLAKDKFFCHTSNLYEALVVFAWMLVGSQRPCLHTHTRNKKAKQPERPSADGKYWRVCKSLRFVFSSVQTLWVAQSSLLTKWTKFVIGGSVGFHAGRLLPPVLEGRPAEFPAPEKRRNVVGQHRIPAQHVGAGHFLR